MESLVYLDKAIVEYLQKQPPSEKRRLVRVAVRRILDDPKGIVDYNAKTRGTSNKNIDKLYVKLTGRTASKLRMLSDQVKGVSFRGAMTYGLVSYFEQEKVLATASEGHIDMSPQFEQQKKMRHRLDVATEKLDQQQETINQYLQQITKKDNQINSLQSQVTEFQQKTDQINSLQSQITEFEQEAEQLNSKIKQLEQCNQKTESYRKRNKILAYTFGAASLIAFGAISVISSTTFLIPQQVEATFSNCSISQEQCH